jgi:hypothetical protein
MLNKIGLFTFFFSLGATALLRWQIPAVDEFLKPISIPVPLESDLVVPLGTLLPALLIGVVSRMVKLHNVVSTIFGIRRRFDVEHVLLPLALATGVKLKPSQIRNLARNRADLMAKVFYAYASGTPEKALIDKHYITMALDQWSWYWVLVEANVIFAVTAVIFFVEQKPQWTAWLLTTLLLGLVLLTYMKGQCAEYARSEIDEILKVKGASRCIADQLTSLTG